LWVQSASKNGKKVKSYYDVNFMKGITFQGVAVTPTVTEDSLVIVKYLSSEMQGNEANYH